MAVKILNSFRLQFNRELTSELPAKMNPKYQNVVFTKPDGSIGGIFSREVLENLRGNTEEKNLRVYGLSNEAISNGYWKTAYAYLRPDVAKSVGAFRFTPS